MFDFILDQLKQLKDDLTANKQEKADKIIKNSMVWSMGAGLIPIPIADMVAVTAIQVDMLKEICKIYEVNFSEHEINSWLTTLSGSMLSRLGAEAIKVIPVVGTVLGGISMAAISGASTYAAGQVFVDHFEKGGTLENFDAEKVADFYKAQFEKGKAFAEDLVKDRKNPENEEKTANPSNENKEKEAEKSKKENLSGKEMFQHIKDHFEKGGTLENFDTEKVKDFYKSQFEKGKAFAEDLIKEPKTPEKEEKKANPSSESKEKTAGKDVFQQIKELSEMYEKGMLSKTEFDQIKAKILGN
ncbi:MAG: DUF697 domain-containing protein [Bacteroidetes bacterium]|nr:MAG: DUF697 domain-containing protein [Bacteroidota bacterium]